MTEKEYRAHPAISRSELWRMHESPEKFKFYRDNPSPATPSLVFGQLVHKLLLQPDTFGDEFVVAPAVDRRTKSGKEAYEAFLQELGDRTAVSVDDYEKAQDMVTAAFKNPLVANLLNGEKEVPFFWTDPDTDVECKCRVDCIIGNEDGKYFIVDYKTAGNAKTDIFNNSLFRYGYHFQAAMYGSGVKAALDLDYMPDFLFIVQEKNPPYSVNVISVTPDVMLAGIDVYRELLGLYADCSATGFWYGYNGPMQEPNEAYLPGWMQLGVEGEDEE